MKFFKVDKRICSIKFAAERSGLSAHVIRVWEKRYQAVKPARTPSNRRLYSQSDVLRLQLLKKVVDEGHSISQVANLSSDELMRIINSDNRAGDGSESDMDFARWVDHYYRTALKCIWDLNADKLKNVLEQASVHATKPQLIESVIVPLCKEIGRLWRQGKLKIIHEHMATPVIRSVLWSLLDAPQAEVEAPRIVIATPMNLRHDLGALSIAVIARDAGWHTAYFGSNLPAAEIAAAAIAVNAHAVALSITFCLNKYQIVKEIKMLRNLLQKETVIFIGGRGAQQVMDQLDGDTAQLITDLQNLRAALDQLLACRSYQTLAN